MTILDQLRETPKGLRYHSDFGAPAITEINCRKTGDIRPHQLDSNEEYELAAKVAVTFWANKAQYHHARKIAEKVLLQRLYGDTLALLNEAEKAVFDGDGRTVIEVLNRIRTNLVSAN